MNWLDGKKTVIGVILHGIARSLELAGMAELSNVISVVADSIMLVGISHKGIKLVK